MCFLTCCLLIGHCQPAPLSSPCHGSVEQTFADIQRAIVGGHGATFRSLLSERTLALLKRHFGKDKVDAAVEFMLWRIKAGLPLRVVKRRRSEEAARAPHAGERKSKPKPRRARRKGRKAAWQTETLTGFAPALP
jgi:hypothetical protein